MAFDLSDTLALLARTPAVLDALLRGSSAAWHARTEGPGTWSALDVVGHLVHGEETDWVPRARLILAHDDPPPFEPFDRFAQEHRFAGWPVERLLDRFAACRAENVAAVRAWHLSPADLARTGTHPALGTVTLAQLLATWAVHDLNHLGQCARAMAGRYADDVGPWRAYLSILPR